MRTQVRYDPDKGILHVRASGEHDPEAFGRILEEITGSREYPPDVPTLWDMREFDFSGLRQEDFRGLIDLRKRHPRRGQAKIAAVVAGDVSFGLGRMYQLLSSAQDMPQRMRIFRSMADAETWLLERD